MYKSSLIRLLRSLNEEEVKEFGYFVRSPFFNRNQGLIKLYDYVKDQYPEFEENKLNRKNVYTTVFDKVKYNDGFMRVLISNLSKLLKDYLSYKNYKKRPIRTNINLLNELNLRNLAKEFRSVLNETEKSLRHLSDTDMWYYHDKALLEDNKYYFNSWSGNKKSGNINKEKMLNNIMDNFTRFYLLSSLTMYRVVLHINNYNKLNVDLKFTEEVLKLLEKKQDDFNDAPIINILLNEIMLLSNGSRKYYEKLKVRFIKSSEGFIYNEIYSLLNILQKFSTVQVLKGKFIYEKERFFLYKTAVLKNMLKHPFSDYIEGQLFFSIVIAALTVKEYDWTWKFINEQKRYLSTDSADTFLKLSIGYYYFERNEYNRAKQAVQGIKTKSYDILFSVKILMMKIYYSEENYEQAELLIDSFRHLLNRSENSYAPILQESYSNFLKCYAWLIKAKEKRRTEFSEKVLIELKKNKTVLEFHWLKKNAEIINQ
jgi:hypothetical protein